ncbi:MAG: hypothetical protein HYW28_00425 [Rhodospirillales bacterium]|nr:hypothetical protein [Rhodospirillales bacterium]MBI2584332.1 hypothetical protein [Rhodospirillales bacterium]MBI2979103.1 hypothetical protein [Rhodospirillales bacterium]
MWFTSRRAGISAVLLGVAGRLLREGQVIHIVAERLSDLTSLLRHLEADGAAGKTAAPSLPVAVRDFH